MQVRPELSQQTYDNQPISSWALEDRPREKMSTKGKNALSDAELLAIILGSGSRYQSAVQLAQTVLASVDNNLNALGELKIKDFKRFKGIGEAKAIAIAAAMEIGRRRQGATVLERPQIRSSQDAYQVLSPMVMDLSHEEFWILVLNRANKVIGKVQISSGGLSGTVVDTKKLYQRCLEFERVNAIILCHNHPSGNLSPSQADLDVTTKIIDAGKLLDIKVLDHLIISGPKYLSFADEGYIWFGDCAIW